MPETELHADDPRLTAYALGELDPTERDTVERLLADSPALQGAVRDIRDLAGLLAAELKQEPAPALTAVQRTAILEGKAPAVAARSTSRKRATSRWISQFAALASMAALVAVAALLPAPGNRPEGRLPSANYWNENAHDFSDEGGKWSLALQQQAQLTEFDALQMDSDVAEIGHEVTSLEAGSAVSAASGLFRDVEARNASNGSRAEGVNINRTSEMGYGGGFGNKQSGTSRATAAERKPAMREEASAKDARYQTAQTNPVPEVAMKMKRSSGQPGSHGRVPASDPAMPRQNSPQPASRSGGEAAEAQGLMEERDRSVRQRIVTSRTRDEAGQPEGYIPGAGATARPVAGAGSGSGKGGPSAGAAGSINGAASGPRPFRAYFGEAEKRMDDAPKANSLSLSSVAAGDGEHKESYRRAWFELPPGTEAYDPIVENPFLSSYEDPLSTFGIDVDTASYANVRRFLTGQQLPPPNAVRIEELVNYFSYDYPQPAGDQPFSVNVEAGRCPWNPTNGLVRIGLKGREIDRDKRPASNLVFLVDVSGSMQAENKLPLVKMGLNLLTQQMTESDKVAIVTYSDTAVQRLPSTNGTNKAAINGVIDSLQAGGSTNGAGGIQLAYRAAVQNFVPGGTNRVILCTDGDFNVGTTDDDHLVKLIQDEARTKVFFSVLGFGMGNLKDGKLEKLADKGNGQYAYIDSQNEARKVFVDDLAGTLVTIAKDVKIQVEFNPNQVGAYRLIGYENRMMAAQDFNNDAKDAGDIGAGHTVTALYETIRAGEAPKPLLGETLRYRNVVVPKDGGLANELLTVKLRYKLPEADTSTLVEVPVADPKAPVSGVAAQPEAPSPPRTSRDFNWAAAVAAFGMILRDSQFRGQANFDMVLELAQGEVGEDKGGRRREFIELVKSAKALYGGASPAIDGAPVLAPIVPLTREQAEEKAGNSGKYLNLLRIVEAPGDAATYGSFHDYGRWDGSSYAGQNNLPQGYWVYVAPNWYIWGDEAQRNK